MEVHQEETKTKKKQMYGETAGGRVSGGIYKSAVSPQTFLPINNLQQQKPCLLEICCLYKFVSFAWEVILGTFAAWR